MDIENVLRIFGSLSGLDEPAVTQYRYLCDMAFDNIASRLRDAESQQDGGRADFAAAALAYYRYVLLCVTDPGGITVGEVTVRDQGQRLEYADRLMKEALADIRELADDREFVFERI